MTQIDIENVGQPGKTYRVDAVKFAEMKRRLSHLAQERPRFDACRGDRGRKAVAGSNPLPRRRHRGLVGQISSTGP